MPQGNIKSRASSTDSARQCFHRKFDNFCRSKNMVINLFWTVFSPLTRIDNIECRFTYTFFPRSLYSGTFFPIDISRCCFTAWNFHSIAINTSVKSSSTCSNPPHESTCLHQLGPLIGIMLFANESLPCSSIQLPLTVQTPSIRPANITGASINSHPACHPQGRIRKQI